MKNEIITEEKLKKRWMQMEEMNAIFNQSDAWTQGYLRGCAVTTAVLGHQEKKAG